MNRNDLKRMYGSTPKGFQGRIEQTLLQGMPAKASAARCGARRILRAALVTALALVALSAVAAAAFSSQVADFFGSRYGKVIEEELRTGDIAASPQSITLGGAVYTLHEVVYAEGRLYGIGSIQPANDSFVLMAEDYQTTDAAGYGLCYGEESRAPEGAPTYAEVAATKNAKLLLVRALPEAIGVDGGDILNLPSVGYDLIPMTDGSIQFSFELPAGVEVERGETYSIRLWISNIEVTPEGEPLMAEGQDTYLAQQWTVEIAPHPSDIKEDSKK